MREAKIIDQFDKEDSFDRLFPNQDEHSGKGFGNLIALPMQGKARENNNTIFLNPENNLLPVDDQWELLKNIQKISLLYSHEVASPLLVYHIGQCQP